MTSAAKIQIDGIARTFGSRRGERRTIALRDFSLQVGAGELVCLLGPSGCGKSTVLDLVAGFDRPDEGQIQVAGKPVEGPSPERGIVFQQPALFPWLNVMDNITFAPRMAGIPARTSRDAAERLIDLVGLKGFERHAPYELSGGMRQRVAIARAWISEPSILLMDEPFGALDAQTRLDMQELLLALRARTAATLLFVTHDVEEALFLADRVVVMTGRPGRVALELQLPFGRERTYRDLVADPEFGRLKSRIIETLRPSR